MKKTFIIASTGDRAEGLERLLISLTPFFLNGWKAVCVCQKYSEEDILKISDILGRCGRIINKSELVGAHSAKLIALNLVSSDIWCSLDDDMFALPDVTDYEKIANILIENRHIGFVSGNWAKTAKMAMAKTVIDKLIPQKLVFTGGGLLFRDDVADIIRNIPNEQYLFDDCLWAMYAYINGYSNYRYQGSVAVHQICTTGGRKSWLKVVHKNNRVLPPAEYLSVRPSKDADGYYICNDKDLTSLAHELHKRHDLK